jgi:hypothetical protein
MVVSRQLERLFDLRTIRRNIRSGLLTKERYEEYLRSLPDVTENLAPLSSMDEDGEAKREGASSPAARAPLPITRRADREAIDDDDDDDDDDQDDKEDGDDADADDAG